MCRKNIIRLPEAWKEGIYLQIMTESLSLALLVLEKKGGLFTQELSCLVIWSLLPPRPGVKFSSCFTPQLGRIAPPRLFDEPKKSVCVVPANPDMLFRLMLGQDRVLPSISVVCMIILSSILNLWINTLLLKNLGRPILKLPGLLVITPRSFKACCKMQYFDTCRQNSRTISFSAFSRATWVPDAFCLSLL